MFVPYIYKKKNNKNEVMFFSRDVQNVARKLALISAGPFGSAMSMEANITHVPIAQLLFLSVMLLIASCLDINRFGQKVASPVLQDFLNPVKPLSNVYREKSLKNLASPFERLIIWDHNRGHFLQVS